MSRRKRRPDELDPQEAARMREVTELIKAGRWRAPIGDGLPDSPDWPELPEWPDDGGLGSGVPKRPLAPSGRGSAAVEEPDNPEESAADALHVEREGGGYTLGDIPEH
jgi:hypothetical protein